MPDTVYGPDTRVGLVGLGIMGAPLAQRFAERGHAVVAWNLEPERYALVRDAGVAWAASPAAVRAASDVVFLCVLGDDAVESCALGRQGFASAGGARVLVDLSTTSPAATRALAPRLREAGMDWVDAPMSGGPLAAADGTLTLLLGGPGDLCAALGPLLSAIAGNVTRMGPLGAGQTAKVLNQAVVGVNYVLMAELLAMARGAGIDPGLLPGALAGGMADSTILQRILPQMTDAAFDPPRARAAQLDKDLKAVRDFVDGLGLDLPVLAAAIERYHAFAVGNPMADTAAIARSYAPPPAGDPPAPSGAGGHRARPQPVRRLR